MLLPTFRIALAMSACAASSVLAADATVTVERLLGNVQRVQEGQAAKLLTGAKLEAGTFVRTPGKGAVELSVNGVPTVFAGADAELLLHSVEASMVRMRLSQGAMHIDARVGAGRPSRDVRLNLGELKLRVSGAQAWAQQTSDITQVCLITGVVEVRRQEQLDRIDLPGQCLRVSPTGAAPTWSRVPPEVLNERIALAGIAPDNTQPVQPTPVAAAPKKIKPAPVAAPPAIVEPVSPVATVETASPAEAPPATVETLSPVAVPSATVEPESPAEASPVMAETASPVVDPPVIGDPVSSAEAPPAASEPESAAAAEPAAVSPRHWSVVLASLATQQAADQEVARLKKLGVHAEVRAYQVAERAGFRVGVGRHDTRKEADRALGQFKRQHPKLGGWLAQY
ncbi:MAG: SPOR domain-containing protein [Panacagrimonas sp.]